MRERWHDAAYEVTGLDGSPRMVDVARDRAARDNLDVAYEVADVGTRLPFADGSLGGVLAILVIQHLPDPASFVTEIRRCLRPGGHLLLLHRARSPGRASDDWEPPTGDFWAVTCRRAVPGLCRSRT